MDEHLQAEGQPPSEFADSKPRRKQQANFSVISTSSSSPSDSDSFTRRTDTDNLEQHPPINSNRSSAVEASNTSAPAWLAAPTPQRANMLNLSKLTTSGSFLSPDSASSNNGSSADGEDKPHKTRSIVNLTSPTLFGIYSPSSIDSPGGSASVNPSEPPTPRGLGSMTPSRSGSVDQGFGKLSFTNMEARGVRGDKRNMAGSMQRKRTRSRSMSLHRPRRTRLQRLSAVAGRAILLAGMGMAYGKIITHLHKGRSLTPLPVDVITRGSWLYILFWALAGTSLGLLMPWVDAKLVSDEALEDEVNEPTRNVEQRDLEEEDESSMGNRRTSLGADWNPIVRSIGAFVGIAFAVRKLPWRSTLQVSLTLALVNPVIWFLIDRSSVGLLLSTVVGVTSAAALMLINPDMVPTPSTATAINLEKLGIPAELTSGPINYESIGVAVWIASVMFCSCIFFGNIGRRLMAERKVIEIPADLR